MYHLRKSQTKLLAHYLQLADSFTLGQMQIFQALPKKSVVK